MVEFRCVSTGSIGNCYYIRDGDRWLMLDCGEKVKWQDVLRGCDFHISSVDAMLCSHRHMDHLPNVKKLHTHGIPIISNDETAEFVQISQGEKIKGIREKALEFLPGKWSTVAWYVPHTSADSYQVPCFAYYVESPTHYRMVYITDFLYSKVVFRNMKPNLILIACNHDNDVSDNGNEAKFRHIISGHSSLSVVNELIKTNQTKELEYVILCHLSTENATPDAMVQTIQSTVGDSVKVLVAHKGMKITLREDNA